MTIFFSKANFPLSAAVSIVAVVVSSTAYASQFNVDLRATPSSNSCAFIGSMLQIDPATGNVTIDVVGASTCNSGSGGYPEAVTAVATNGVLVPSATQVGGGTSGSGVVNVLLSTGLSAVDANLRCVTDGITSSVAHVTATGWSGVICGAGSSVQCGPTHTMPVTLSNSSTSTNGAVNFKAICSYAGAAPSFPNAVATTVTIAPSSAVTVLHGTAPVVDYCSAVTQLSSPPHSLTVAQRQTVGTATGGITSGAVDFTNFNSVFGVATNVGGTAAEGYGFPGTNRSLTELRIERDKYVSLRFRAPLTPAWTNIPGAFFTYPVASVTSWVAISRCPGQFAQDAVWSWSPVNAASQVCLRQPEGPLSWIVTNSTSHENCQLIPGNTYYLNIMQSNTPAMNQTFCNSSSCNLKLKIGL